MKKAVIRSFYGKFRPVFLAFLFFSFGASVSAEVIRARFVTPPWPGGWSNMRNTEQQSAVIEVNGAPAGTEFKIIAAFGIKPDSTAEEIAAALAVGWILDSSGGSISGDGQVLLEEIYPPTRFGFYQLWITVNGDPVLPWEGDSPAPGDFWVLLGQTLYEGPQFELSADLSPSYVGGAAELDGDLSLDINNVPNQEWDWRTGYRWALEQGGARLGEAHDFPAGITYLKGPGYGQDNEINTELPPQWDWPSGGGALKLRVGRWDETTGDFADPVADPEPGTPEGGEFGAAGPEIVLHEACTAPAAPSNLNGTPGGTITVNWDAVTGAGGYLVRYGNAQSGYTVVESASNNFSFEASAGQSYEIRVRAWKNCGDWRVYSEKSGSITVQSAGVTVQLDVSATAAAPDDALSFTNHSTISGLDPASVSFSLDFGDGSNAPPGVGETVEHTYSSGGTYTATLSASWTGGGSASDSKQIVVKTPLKLSIKAEPGAVTNGKRAYTFTADVPVGVEPVPDHYQWNFNGTPVGSGTSLSRQIPLSESFDVVLTASRNAPFSDSAAAQLHGVAADDTESTVAGELDGEAAYSYFVAASARTAGQAGSQWYSDLAVLNPPGGTDSNVRLYFLEAGQNNTNAGGLEIELTSGASVYIQDIVGSLFGRDTGTGAILLASDTPLLVSSRIYDAGGEGTFGQYLGGKPSISGQLDGKGSRLIQLAQSADFRTNVGFVNLHGAQLKKTDLHLGGIDADSQNLELRDSVLVPPFSMKQISSVFTEDSDDAILDVRYGSELPLPSKARNPGLPRSLVTYASVVDNNSNDPTTVTPVLPITPDQPGYISVVARLNGANNTVWRSDVELHNPGESRARYTLRFRSDEKTGSLDAGRSIRYADILGSLFGLDSGAKGRLKITVSSGEILATSRTYNETEEGTFGQFIPAIPDWAATRRGDILYSAQIVENEDFRSNIGFANATDAGIDLEIRLYNRDGSSAGSTTKRLPINVTKQWTISELFDVEDFIGWLEVEIPQGTGMHKNEPAVLGYLSLVDNTTGDPTYIPLFPLRPVAEFEWVPEHPAAGQTIQLIDRSLGYPSSWSWMGLDADDAEVLNSTERDPTFTPAANGDYEITLSLDENGVFPASVTKTIRISEVGLEVPVLSLEEVTASSIEISWSAVDGATAYELSRDGGAWANQGTARSYTDENLDEGEEYCYRVRARKGVASGEASEQLCATTLTRPAAAPELSVDGVTSTSIELSWTAVEAADSYALYRGETEVYAGGELSFTDSGLEAGTEYCYTIEAVNEAGVGPRSDPPLCATTAEASELGTPILEISTFTANSISLSWNTVENAEQYEVFHRMDDESSFTALTTVSSGTNYIHESLEPGHHHYYQVRAISTELGSGAFSNTVDQLLAPGTPGNFQTISPDSSHIDLSWNAVFGADSYEISRDGGAWVDVGNVLSWTDDTVEAGTEYCYRVRAVNATGEGPESTASCATPPVDGAPANLQALAVSATEINVSWDAVNGAVGYKIRIDSGSWNDIGNVTNYQHSGLGVGTQHCYEVLAYSSGGADGPSAGPACVTTLVTGAPANLQATAVSTTEIDVSWSAVSTRA